MKRRFTETEEKERKAMKRFVAKLLGDKVNMFTTLSSLMPQIKLVSTEIALSDTDATSAKRLVAAALLVEVK